MQIILYEDPRRPGTVVMARSDQPSGEPAGWMMPGICTDWPNTFSADARSWACGEYTPSTGGGASPVADLSPFTPVATWTDGRLAVERDDGGRLLPSRHALVYIGPVPGLILPLHVQNLYRMARVSAEVGTQTQWMLVLRGDLPLLVTGDTLRDDDRFVADAGQMGRWLDDQGLPRGETLPEQVAADFLEHTMALNAYLFPVEKGPQ